MTDEDDICAGCGEQIAFIPGQTFMASVDGKVWHKECCSPRMTNTIGATPEERELIERLQFLRCQPNSRRSNDAVDDALETAADTLESLISDRAKLREALERATNMLDNANRSSDRPTNFMYGIVSDNRALLANTTKVQGNG